MSADIGCSAFLDRIESHGRNRHRSILWIALGSNGNSGEPDLEENRHNGFNLRVVPSACAVDGHGVVVRSDHGAGIQHRVAHRVQRTSLRSR